MSNAKTATAGSVASSFGNVDQAAKLKLINEQNRAFYHTQSEKLLAQLNPTTIQIALHQRKSEASRGISINFWSFDRAIDDASRASTVVKLEQAQKAGESKKTDSLQKLILDIVRAHPQVTVSQLRARLESNKGKGIIDDMGSLGDSNPLISFEGLRGRVKDAPLSGLKDRLTRARKTIRQEEIAQTR
jgi:hypothetical protein